MDLKEVQINFVCPNIDGFYEKGELRLPLPFYVDYGDELGEKLKLKGPVDMIWIGKYPKKSKSIKELTDMMSFYQIKPYHMVLLEYVGDSEFNFQVYNPYAVEMNYSANRPACRRDLVWDDTDLEKFECIFSYNARENFTSVHHMVIEARHMLGTSFTEVLNWDNCKKIGLCETSQLITFAFEDREWPITVKWVHGIPLFDKEWNWFLEDAKIKVGDTIVLIQTAESLKFKICIFEHSLLATEDSSSGEELVTIPFYGSFFKVVTDHTLDLGELEVPHLFFCKYGNKLGNRLKVYLGHEMSTNFNFIHNERKISGLNRFLRKYDVNEGYLLIFRYLGNSEFELSVFDTQCMNHLRHCYGNYRFEDFMFPSCDHEVIEISDSVEVISEDFHSDMDGMDISESDVSSDSSDSSEDSADLNVDEELWTFRVVVKSSHLDQRGHGAYIRTNLFPIYNMWNKNTVTTLVIGRYEYEVHAIRTGTQCRFGKGWNAFVRDNNLRIREQLLFRYMGDFTFEVSRI